MTHGLLIGLTFIGMVFCPAVVATFSHAGMEDDDAQSTAALNDITQDSRN